MDVIVTAAILSQYNPSQIIDFIPKMLISIQWHIFLFSVTSGILCCITLPQNSDLQYEMISFHKFDFASFALVEQWTSDDLGI